MNLFTISQLQQFSGIKAQTIRAWEQRYEAFSPGRSAGNTRYYTDLELKRLLNIKHLLEHGQRISSIAHLTDEELTRQTASLSGLHTNKEYYITKLICAAIAYDEYSFEQTLSEATKKFGTTGLYCDIILPLLTRTGSLWLCNDLDPSQEHFLSNLIRKKLFVAIDALPLPDAGSKKWLLFLPEDEFHETGLLMAYYLIRKAGFQVCYLGNSVAAHTFAATARNINPDYVLLFIVHNRIPEATSAYLQQVKRFFKQQEVFVAGDNKLLDQLALKQISKLDSVQSLVSMLKTLKNI